MNDAEQVKRLNRELDASCIELALARKRSEFYRLALRQLLRVVRPEYEKLELYDPKIHPELTMYLRGNLL